jgi:OOP family OmpA-OmpF porin
MVGIRDKTKEGFFGQFGVRETPPDYRTYLYPITLNLRYNLFTDKKVIPYVLLGGSYWFWDLRDITGVDVGIDQYFSQPGTRIRSSLKYDPSISWGAGVEFKVADAIGIEVSGRVLNILEHGVDMSGEGDNGASSIEARLGLNFHFGGKKDTDGDGILDKHDKCKTEPEDFDGFEDEDGCPDLDNDNDGIPDLMDQCPNEAEDFDGFEDEDGCPDLDNDGDGILDQDDMCPDEAEVFNDFEDEDGCPDELPVEEEVMVEEQEQVEELEVMQKIVLEGVHFALNSVKLTDASKAILDDVSMTLQKYPDVEVWIYGHTCDLGTREYNLRLSKGRAEAVYHYLVNKGIDAKRMSTKGFGFDQPIAPNDSEENRSKNRRVEFVIKD